MLSTTPQPTVSTPQSNVGSIIANYKASNPTTSSGAPAADVSSWYSQMKAGTFSAPSDTTQTPAPTENPIVGAAKSIISPAATMIARPFQAASDLGDYLGTQEAINETSDPGAKAAITEADTQRENIKQTQSSGPGGIIAPIPKNAADEEKDVGRGIETVALGLGPAAGGAAFGAGASLEQGNKVLSPATAVDTVLGLAGGKALDLVGKPIFNAVGKVVAKITPQLISDIASKGASAISDFAKTHNILPEQVSHVINDAAAGADKLANKPFTAASDAIRSVAKPVQEAKENFQASRGNINNRGLAAPAERLAAQAPLIGAGAAREPKMSDVYNQAVKDSEAHLNDPTAVDKPIEKFGQNEVSSAFDTVVAQRKAAGKAMGAELEKPEVGGIKTNVADVRQSFINDLGKQKLEYTPKNENVTSRGIKTDVNQTGRLTPTGQTPLTGSDRGMLEDYVNDLHTLGDKPSVADVDAFIKRTTGDLDLYKQKNQIMGTTNGERLIKGNLTDLRNTISAKATGNNALKPYSAAKAEFARLSPIVERGTSLLGKPDLDGGYVKDASVAKRAVQSITNGGTKDFMRSLENETGKPLLDHAYLILQAMKDTGDTSAHSLLDMFAKDASDGKLPNAETIWGKAQQWAIKHGTNKIAGTPVEQTQAFLKSIENAKKSK